MKRSLQIALIAAAITVMSACHNHSENVQTDEQLQETAAQDNTMTSSTPKIKTGEVNVINEDKFIAWITDVENDKGFQYKGDMPAIVDCYADWCRPCHAINPIMVELAKKYEGKIIIYKLNVDKAARVSKAFEITSIPSLLFFKPNAQPVKLVGAQAQENYERAINELLLNE